MSVSSSRDITKGVVLVEVTSRDVSSTEPYRVMGRSKGVGTAFRVPPNLFPPAAWNCENTQLYLTNFHVVEGAEKRRVRLRVSSSPEYTSGTVVHAVPSLDFALISVNMSGEPTADDNTDPFCSAPSSVLQNVKPIELYVGEVVPAQQAIVACGFPMGYLEQYVSKGVLAGRQSCGDSTSDYFSMDISLNSGNSGGPCVFQGGSHDGQCFAISTATEGGEAIQIAYSVPVVNIMAWFRNHYKKGSVLGRFPRWGFSLASRTGAFDDEHKFPSNLDGAIVSKVCEKSKYNLKTGDVLVSINRGTETVLLDKFGSITDKQHGDPKFSIMNSGFIVSCDKNTTVTVWRPSISATRTLRCAPEPPLLTEKMCYASFAPPHYALLGSMVFMNATADFIGAGMEEESEDEEDSISPAAAFHILRKIHADKSRMVTVVSHLHCDSYVSSTRTLHPGDILKKIGRTEIKSSQHAETVIQRLAAEHATGMRKRVKITTETAQTWLDLDSLLQEERLVEGEREDVSKLMLLQSHAAALASKKTRKRKPTRQAPAGARPGSRPGSPKAEKRRRKSSRLAAMIKVDI